MLLSAMLLEGEWKPFTTCGGFEDKGLTSVGGVWKDREEVDELILDGNVTLLKSIIGVPVVFDSRSGLDRDVFVMKDRRFKEVLWRFDSWLGFVTAVFIG